MSTGRDKVNKLKGIIKALVISNSIIPKFINRRLFYLFRNTSGNIGLLIRYVIFKNLSKSCGDNVSIHPGVFLKGLSRISIGNNVSIHSMCYIDGTGGLKIGNDVSIAHASTIMTTSHTYQDISIPIKYNKATQAPVTIENDVWIGCGCRILSGVIINSRSIIAAGAVVNKNVEPNTISGGVPAKILKSINTKTS
ncbi:acyltransferase [Flaviramulus sp. BrNp1-15]|uniref:acyltransferase n=1 Tax=Flaviramulus sp. BrNp1-15 TaxID=2916754 RepID=UPI001EE8A6D6|nr:acyltransferase [Flaviramulus sp. BrNp1-15]ULC58278.1 acyltransferase [Flaviramulus sp. BrNp1-15]